MANPLDFVARIDELRRLKNGSNPDLLEVWTNLVFQGWEWDAKSQDALNRLAAHPYLPASGLSQARWPSVVLRDPKGLKAGIDAGLDPKHIRPALSCTSVRASALFENAPPETHALLDARGVEGLGLKEVVDLFPASITRDSNHSFDYLVEHHWDVVKLAVSPPESSNILTKVFHTYHANRHKKAWGNNSRFKAWCATHVLKTLMLKGVDWVPAIPRDPANPEKTKTAQNLGAIAAEAIHEAMDKALPPPPPSAPRPRARF